MLYGEGNADAHFNLGRCYEEGISVEADEVEAARCFKMAV
jgi:TPR repeat protein